MGIRYNICPRCSSKNVDKIIYGLPSYELLEEVRQGKVKLGGLLMSI